MGADFAGRIRPAEFAVVALTTLAGGALRFYGLGTKSLWYDEAVVYHLAQGGWREILTQNALENSAPPLYALLLGLLTGPDATEGMLRVLSALAGTAAIPLCFLLGRQFLPARSAWLVAVLIAASPTQVIYSQQLREYSLSVVASALLLLAYARFIRSPDRLNAAWVAVAAAIGLLTQYGLGLMLAALNLVCIGAFLARRERLPAFRRWFLTQLPAAALALLLYFTVVRYQAAGVTEAGLGYLRPYLWDGTMSGVRTLLLSPNHDLVALATPGIIAFIFWCIGLLAFAFGARSALATALCLAPMALTLSAAMAGLYPYGAIRQDLFLTPMMFVCVVLGADRFLAILPVRFPILGYGLATLLAPALALPALGVSLRFVNQYPGYEPMRMIAETLGYQLRPGEEVYVYYNAIPAFRYYWRNREEPWLAGAFHRSFMDETKSPAQMARVQDELREISARGQPYWVVVSHLATNDEDWLLEILRRQGKVEYVEQGPGSLLLRITPISGRPF
jgi:hypothetical protein